MSHIPLVISVIASGFPVQFSLQNNEVRVFHYGGAKNNDINILRKVTIKAVPNLLLQWTTWLSKCIAPTHTSIHYTCIGIHPQSTLHTYTHTRMPLTQHFPTAHMDLNLFLAFVPDSASFDTLVNNANNTNASITFITSYVPPAVEFYFADNYYFIATAVGGPVAAASIDVATVGMITSFFYYLWSIWSLSCLSSILLLLFSAPPLYFYFTVELTVFFFCVAATVVLSNNVATNIAMTPNEKIIYWYVSLSLSLCAVLYSVLLLFFLFLLFLCLNPLSSFSLFCSVSSCSFFLSFSSAHFSLFSDRVPFLYSQPSEQCFQVWGNCTCKFDCFQWTGSVQSI